jgi:predicted acetyltransferase
VTPTRIARAEPDELGACQAAFERAFSDGFSEAEARQARELLETERCFTASDAGGIVGSTASYRFELTVPGAALPAAGVTAVGVLPTHRRQGIVTSLMRAQLDDLHERGEPLAALWPSEAGIYRRFGYGLAARNARIDADRWRAYPEIPRSAHVSTKLVSTAEALALLPGIYDKAARCQPGFYSRSPAWWEHHTLADIERLRRGAGPLYRVVAERDGEAIGYALYRVGRNWVDGVPKNTLEVVEEVSATHEGTRAIWEFLFGIDLVERVRADLLPQDHPLFVLAREAPRLRWRLGDGLWIRIVDVVSSLQARSYGQPASLALQLDDDFCPWNAGRWRLEGSPDGGQLTRITSECDVRLDSVCLAAVYLGGFSFVELGRAGKVQELRPGALARADALFRIPTAPWTAGAY